MAHPYRKYIIEWQRQMLMIFSSYGTSNRETDHSRIKNDLQQDTLPFGLVSQGRDFYWIRQR